MNPDQLLSLAQQHLRSQNTTEAKNLLRQVLQMVPDHIQAGLMLVTLELQDQQAAAAMDILSGLWKRTRNPMVGDVMADLGSSVSRAAAQQQKADRKVFERIAGLLKAVQGSKKILVDTLEYDIVGGLAIDALRLVPLYKKGLTDRTGKSVVFFSGKPANPALVEMLSRQLPVFTDPDFPRLMPYMSYNWSEHQYTLNKKFSEDFFGRHADLFESIVDFIHSTNGKTYCYSNEEYAAIQPYKLEFSETEEEKGEHFLRDIVRLPDDAWFVCIYARDGEYYNESPRSPNWFRNADINTYLPAIDEILARGGHVIRVGAKTNQKLNHPDLRVYDYSNSGYREPLMDIYLMAKCRFFLGTPSGYGHVASIFQTPQVHINTINGISFQCDLWIPKKILDTRTNQLLPYAEFYKRYFGSGNIGLFAENGKNQEKMLYVRYVDNSPDEITAAAVEMMNRLDSTYIETAAVKMMRERFGMVWDKWKIHVDNRKIASCFIDLHPDLFITMQESECVLT